MVRDPLVSEDAPVPQSVLRSLDDAARGRTLRYSDESTTTAQLANQRDTLAARTHRTLGRPVRPGRSNERRFADRRTTVHTGD